LLEVTVYGSGDWFPYPGRRATGNGRERGFLLFNSRHDPWSRTSKLFRQAGNNAFEPKVLAVSIGLRMFLEGLVLQLSKNLVYRHINNRNLI